MRDCRCRPMLSNACTLPSDALVSRIDRPFTVFVQKVPGRKSSELCLTSRGSVSSIVLSRETRSADVYVSGGDMRSVGVMSVVLSLASFRARRVRSTRR